MQHDATPLEDWVLRSLQEDAVVLPALPLIASRLVDALEHPDADADRVEEIIGQDASITAQVIRAANSVLYAPAVPIETLRAAILRMGFRETANVAMAAAGQTLFAVENRAELQVFPELWQELWQSSLGGAYGARLISTELKLGDPGRAFLSAMFRDVGELLILKLVASGLVHGSLRGEPSGEELQRVFQSLHQQLGADYLRRFEMPRYLVEVVESHHAASLPFAHDTVVIHIVRLADALFDQLGISPFASGSFGPAGEQSAELLGLDADRIEYFSLQLASIDEQVRDLF